MTRLETFVAATAVIVLGLVTSLNVLDQGTLSQITSHPTYQQIFSRTAETSKAVAQKAESPKTVAQKPVPKESSAAEGLVAKDALQDYWQKVKKAGIKVKNNAVQWLKSVDFDSLKSRGERVVAKVKKLIAGDKAAMPKTKAPPPKTKAAKKSPAAKQEEQG